MRRRLLDTLYIALALVLLAGVTGLIGMVR
jgi:hypothetical protein